MINFTKKLFNSTNEKEKLLAEKLKQRADLEQEEINKLNNKFIKSIELNKKKEACNLYLEAYTSKKPLNETKFNIYQNYNNPISYYEQMRGSNNFYQSKIGNPIFGNIFG